jgi:dipeptidyl-peptidase III
MGFIETYVDPLGSRAEYEGWVAVVDKESTKKFQRLVDIAPLLLTELPWSKDFEKDVFKAPDFTDLTVVNYASSDVPVGINLPNYNDVRMKYGFKNVNLGNAYLKFAQRNVTSLTPEDYALSLKYADDSDALHELVGHGSGKLLTKNNVTGELNYPAKLTNPFTGEPITNPYLSTETYEQRFGKLAGAYEECRAEGIALYLAFFNETYEIFCNFKNLI